MQTDLLSLNRASLYSRPVGPDPVERAGKHRIDEIYTAQPVYGSRRMAAQWQREGHTVNRQRIHHDRRDRGIWGLAPGPKTSTPHPGPPIYPYLLKGILPAYPHHVWGIAITSGRLRQGWLYLVAIIGGYSRYVLAWALSESLGIILCPHGGAASANARRPDDLES